MRTSKGSIGLRAVAVGLLIAGAGNLFASDPNMDRAMKAVFEGPEVKKLKVMKHEFNVKPVKTTRSGQQTKISGQISHHLRFRDDDQVYYDITLNGDGTLAALDVRVDRSLMQSVLGKAWEAALAIVKSKINDELSDIGSASQGLTLSGELEAREKAIALAESKLGTGGWEKAAAAIVANVALRAKTNRSGVYDRVNFLRKQAPRNTTPTRVRGTAGKIFVPGNIRVRDHRR